MAISVSSRPLINLIGPLDRLVTNEILLNLSCLQILLVLSKMDASYRQMRNEALLMLQLTQLKKEISQDITVVEASAMTGEGIDNILKWLQGDSIVPAKPNK
jgi:selenocysteine-specific translation elongation factor